MTNWKAKQSEFNLASYAFYSLKADNDLQIYIQHFDIRALQDSFEHCKYSKRFYMYLRISNPDHIFQQRHKFTEYRRGRPGQLGHRNT